MAELVRQVGSPSVEQAACIEFQRGGRVWRERNHNALCRSSRRGAAAAASGPAGAWMRLRCSLQIFGPLPDRYVADCRMGQPGVVEGLNSARALGLMMCVYTQTAVR